MEKQRSRSRRSFLQAVIGVALAAPAAALAADPEPSAESKRRRSRRQLVDCTDRDPGDRVGHGRRCQRRRARRSGITDHDPFDPAGNGRGRRPIICPGDFRCPGP